MVSKTAVAPLDRIKILLQVHHKNYKHYGKRIAASVWVSLKLNAPCISKFAKVGDCQIAALHRRAILIKSASFPFVKKRCF